MGQHDRRAAIPATSCISRMNLLSASLYARFRSREKESFSDKLLSAMRNKFGGHVEPKAPAKAT